MKNLSSSIYRQFDQRFPAISSLPTTLIRFTMSSTEIEKESSSSSVMPVNSIKTYEDLSDPVEKASETRDSVSSVDSSISLSYDAIPFTPRGYIADASTASPRSDQSASVRQQRYRQQSGDSSSSITILSSTDDSSKSTSHENDSEGDPFQPPDAETIKRIVEQVEFYFTDENIVKDAFLLKHVRRNKEGYVSLKLISSFKKVKHIANDWRVVRAALQHSDKLELNETGTKLRRRDPLPVFDQTTPSRTIVAINIPFDCSIESVAEMFHNYGEIAQIRVLRPGNPIPAELRSVYNKHSEMHDCVSTLVEFVRTESAHNALNQEHDFKVLQLNTPATVTAKKKLQERRGSSKSEDDQYKNKHQQRRCSSPRVQITRWDERRWSRDSGNESSTSSVSFPRSRSNSAAYLLPQDHYQRRLSAGWEPGCETSQSRRNSAATTAVDAFQMRRYSIPKKDSSFCCCGFPKCERGNGRRYSIDHGYEDYEDRRCSTSREDCHAPLLYCCNEFYPEQGRYERRASLPRVMDGQWLGSRTDTGRRLSDSAGLGLMRRGSAGKAMVGLPGSSELVARLPRGPDGSRGFQREVIEYSVAE